MPAQKPPKCQNLAPKGSRPRFATSELVLNRPFKGFKLPKRRWKRQKSKIELKVTRTITGSTRPTGKIFPRKTLVPWCSAAAARLTQGHDHFRVFSKRSRSFPKASRSRQIAKIWLQKTPGQQNLAPKGSRPGFGSKPSVTAYRNIKGLLSPDRRAAIPPTQKFNLEKAAFYFARSLLYVCQ